MSEARTLKCSNCGGNLPESARTCAYCKAVVAARRCAECFHMNLLAAVHCAACGHELGLEPVPEPEDLPCPACEAPFMGIPTEASGRVHECTGCGGQWVDHTSLRTLFERRVRLCLDWGRRPDALPSPATTRVRYLPCPMCRQLMNRRNFGERSGVIVDVCRSHGVYFDPGELPRVLAFVARGGLEEAARREAEREREQRKSIAEAASRMSWEHEQSRHHDLGTTILNRLFVILRELAK